MTARLRFRVKAMADSTAGDRLVEVGFGAAGVRIGRAAGMEVPLPFPAVSALHAHVVREGDGFRLEDLGSTNGTFIGCGKSERRLAVRESTPLRVGDCLRVADVALVFEGDEGASQEGVHGTGTIARRLVADLFGVMRPHEVATLTVTSGPSQGQLLRLDEPARSYLIGRAPGCDLVLEDVDASRQHAAVERGWDGIVVRDLDSKNGITLDGTPVAVPATMTDGATLTIGTTVLRLDDPEQRYLATLESAARAELADAERGAADPVVGSEPSEPQAEPPVAAHDPALSSSADHDRGASFEPEAVGDWPASASSGRQASVPVLGAQVISPRSSSALVSGVAVAVVLAMAMLLLWLAFGV